MKCKQLMEKWKAMKLNKLECRKWLSKKMVFVLTAVLVMGSAGCYFRVKVMGQKKDTVVRLPDVYKVETGDLSKRVIASGTTVAANPVSIFIELSQEVDKVYAEVGDKVTVDQLLVTYNIADTKKDLLNKLSEAQITLENAQITLNELKTPATGAELVELKSQVASAEKNLADLQYDLSSQDVKIAQGESNVKSAQKNLEDQKALLAVGGVSQSEVDSAQESYDKAKTDLQELQNTREKQQLSFQTTELALEKAKINLENGENIYNDQSVVSSIAKQENTVKNAKRNVTNYQDEISKLTEATYSPIAGTIIESNAVEGQMITDSTVMMKVADLSNMDVEAKVSEYDIASIQVGQRVEMQSDGIENKIYTGTVIKIEPSATSQSTISGTETVVPITVHMDNADDLVKPGFSFDLEIIVEDLPDVLYVPISAVSKNANGTYYVFAVDETDTLHKTTVEIGSNNDEGIVITSGLQSGDKVISSPTETMADGTKRSDYQTAVSDKNSKSEKSSLLNNVSGGAPSGMSGAGGMSGGNRQGGGIPGGGPR